MFRSITGRYPVGAMQLNHEERHFGGLRRLLWIAGLALGALVAVTLLDRAGGTCPESGNLVVVDGECTPRI